MTIDVEIEDVGTRPLDGQEAVRSGIRDPGLIGKSSENDEVRGSGVTCTGLHEGMTDPLTPDEGLITGT